MSTGSHVESPPNAVDSVSDPGTRGDGAKAPGATDAAGPVVLVAAIVAVVWWAVLITMAVTTTDAVTVNLIQIEQSNLIVTATVLDAAAGRVRVDQVWKGQPDGEEFVVVDLAASHVVDDGTYVLPLKTDSDDRLVVTKPILGYVENDRGRREPRYGHPHVYPTGEEVEQQLKPLLPTD